MSRAAKSRTKGRRRRKKSATFYALPIMLLMSVALAFFAYKLLRIQTITVEGTTRYQTGEIIAASGLEIGASMLQIKPSQINGAIERSLSYIGDAQLRFELPETIILTVEEAEVIGSVYYGDGYLLLSDSYKILQTDSPTPDAQAPIISGIIPHEPKAGEPFLGQNEEDLPVLNNLFDAISRHEMPKITGIHLEDISNIYLTCEENNTILLGGPSDLNYKLEFVSEIMKRYRQEGTCTGLIINAQAIDGAASLSVSVLPAQNIASVSEPTQNSQPSQATDDETAEKAKE